MQQIIIPNGVTATVIQDDVSDANQQTVCENWRVENGGGATCHWNYSGYTQFWRIHGDFGLSEYSGSATIPNGDSTIQVTHTLFGTPAQIFLTNWSGNTANPHTEQY